jgi:hypothetical protein
VTVKMAVSWVVALSRLVWVHQHFRGLYCLHNQGDEWPDDGGSTNLWNFGKLMPVYMALQPRRQSSVYFSSQDVNGPGVYFFRSLLILLLMACWCGCIAIPVGFSPFESGLRFGHRACLISFLLYMFCWQMHLWCWISPVRVSESQSVLSSTSD